MAPQQIESSNNESLLEPLISTDSSIDQGNDTTGNEDDRVVTNKDIVVRNCCRREEEESFRINHNVFFNLILAASVGISQSLWNGTAYVAYLKKLGHDQNGPLGDIEALSGLAQLITALPVGFLADRWGRSKVISVGGCLRLVTIIAQVSAMTLVGGNDENSDIQTSTSTALMILGAVMWFWGVGDGIVNGPCAALYADSTPKGERSIYFNYLFIANAGSSVVGPLVSIILFQLLGDNWSFSDLKIVIYVGLGFEVFNSIYMLSFDDKKALEEKEEEEEEDNDNNNNDDEIESDNREEENQGYETLTASLLPPTATNNNNDNNFKRRQKWIPYIIFIQDIIMAMGSGMTIKFFPLFFKDEVGMTPSQVQIIYCAVPFAMVICSTLCSKIAATGFGRVQTQFLWRLIGISLLYSMVFFKTYLDRHPFYLVPIYVFRTAFMNSCYPLQQSILMDFVPKDVRARWKSLDAVASFGWCGSAALGGWLSDKVDYTYTFLITAIIQSTGLAVWSLLLPLVPRNEKKDDSTSLADDDNNNNASPERNESSEP